jgi:hypothetical protein
MPSEVEAHVTLSWFKSPSAFGYAQADVMPSEVEAWGGNSMNRSANVRRCGERCNELWDNSSSFLKSEIALLSDGELFRGLAVWEPAHCLEVWRFGMFGTFLCGSN